MSAEIGTARAIFLDAIAIESVEERKHFLDDACAGDAALRRQVDRLLRGYARPNPMLDATGGVATIDVALVAEKPGTQIGPYKLLQQIGEGGFGVVYMAEQHKPVRRKVALKIIKPGMDTKEVIARFEAERQALALMDHPNIAKVLDAGATDSGRPYFVMELVRGVPITEFCDEQKLSPRERLQLFVDICRAIQHAHQKGVIHRDLKPTNVMVTLDDNRPIPKVIDFGISKALSQQLTEKTLFTAYGQMVGTPLYMAPEQAQMSMRDVDTRSDVYSLGVLLYELLTGTTPFDKETLQKSGFEEMRRIICEVEPPRPSARVSTLKAEALSTVSDQRKVDARKLSQSLRGELDWIVMKALEKDRNRRYETTSAFAADVERFLNDEPVQACPPTVAYRLRKLVRRYRVETAVAVLAFGFLTAVAVGGFVIAWQAKHNAENQANAKRRIQLALGDLSRQKKATDAALVLAKSRTQFARQSAADLMEVSQTWLSRKRMHALQRRFLEKTLQLHEQLAREQSNDPEIRWAIARSHQQIGWIHSSLGRFDEAERSFQAALAIAGQLVEQAEERQLYQIRQAQILSDLTLVESKRLRSDRAERYAKESIDIFQNFFKEAATAKHSKDVLADAHCWHGKVLHNLGVLLFKQHNDSEARKMLERALEQLARAVALSPTAAEMRSQAVAHHRMLAEILRRLGDPARAKDEVGKALATALELADQNRTEPEYRERVAELRVQLALLVEAFGKHDDAAEHYRQSTEVYRQLAFYYPKEEPKFLLMQARETGRRARCLAETGSDSEANQLISSAFKLYNDKRVIASVRKSEPARLVEARLHMDRAIVLKRQGRPADAVSWTQSAAKLLDALHSERPANREYAILRGRAHLNLGAVTAMVSRLRGLPPSAAQVEHDAKAFEIFDSLVKEEPHDVLTVADLAVSANNLAASRYATRKIDDAERLYRRSIELYGTVLNALPNMHEFVHELAQAQRGLAVTLRSSGKTSEARELIDKAIASLQHLTTAHKTNVEYQGELAQCYETLGSLHIASNPRRAIESVKNAAAIYETLQRRHPSHYEYAFETANVLRNMGLAQIKSEPPDKVKETLESSIEYYRAAIRLRPKWAVSRLRAAEVEYWFASEQLRSQNGKQALVRLRSVIALMQPAVRIQPANRTYLRLLESALTWEHRLLRRTDYPAAAKACLAAIAFYSELPQPRTEHVDRALADRYAALAYCWMEHGDFEKAIVPYENTRKILQNLWEQTKTAEDRANAVKVSWNLAACWNEMGKSANGVAELEAAQMTLPDEMETHRRLAWLLANCRKVAQRDPTRALALAQKAAEANERDAECRTTLGAAYVRAGDGRKAITALNEAIALRSGQPSIKDSLFLAMAHWAVGEKKAAYEHYNIAKDSLEKREPELRRHKSTQLELQRLGKEAGILLGVKHNLE